MDSLILRAPTEADIVYLSQHMRQADINDLTVVGWQSIETAVRLSLLRSDPRYVLSIELRGQLLCMFGCAADSLLSDVGIPWMLGTDAILPVMKSATVKTRQVVRYMLHGWPLLKNVVDARNTSTIRWLETIGFEMGEPYTYHTGFLVVPFEMRRDESFNSCTVA